MITVIEQGPDLTTKPYYVQCAFCLSGITFLGSDATQELTSLGAFQKIVCPVCKNKLGVKA